MDILVLLVDFLLFCLTVFVFSKKPSAKKMLLLILLVSAIHCGQIFMFASVQGLSVYDYYMQSYNNALSQLDSVFTSAQKEQSLEVFQLLAGCWVAISVVQAAWQVAIALLIVWAARKITKKNGEWGAFSSVDLSIWTVLPLIVGILLLVLSWIPQLPYSEIVYLVSLNVLIISTLPLYAQGGAAFKGIMNRANFSGAMQVILMVCGVLTGVAFLVTPLLGLIDYWANFRKLPRDANNAK